MTKSVTVGAFSTVPRTLMRQRNTRMQGLPTTIFLSQEAEERWGPTLLLGASIVAA